MARARWRSRVLIGVAVVATAALAGAWALQRAGHADLSNGQVHPTLRIASASFVDGARMPRKLTCDGASLSPDIKLPVPSPGAKSLALVMDDLDAPFGFVHWLVYDIPPAVRELREGASSDSSLPPQASEGTNDFGKLHYGGPCPPAGTHRYRISLYALDIGPGLPRGKTKKDLAAAVKGHILGEGQIRGLYGKGRR
jgi:Raf kinase inhibitor-like YbhB/YbcL family protein